MNTPSGLNFLLSFADAWYTSNTAHAGCNEVLMSRALFNGGHLGLNYIDLVALEPETSIGLHRHGPYDTEIYVIIEGQGKLTLEENTFAVTAGDVVVNPPNGVHGLINTGSSLLKIVVVAVPLAHDAASQIQTSGGCEYQAPAKQHL